MTFGVGGLWESIRIRLDQESKASLMGLVPLKGVEESRAFSLPCEDIARKYLSGNQEESPRQKPDHTVTL